MRLILIIQRSSSTIDYEVLCRNRTETIVDNACLCDEDATTVALRGLFRILWKKFYASKYHKGVNHITGIRN